MVGWRTKTCFPAMLHFSELLHPPIFAFLNFNKPAGMYQLTVLLDDSCFPCCTSSFFADLAVCISRGQTPFRRTHLLSHRFVDTCMCTLTLMR
eukprot:m.91873 g.91873  ORF g.91873 m.91873 type:complete len:93 (-) comp12964_c0_seq1:71-349(-)